MNNGVKIERANLISFIFFWYVFDLCIFQQVNGEDNADEDMEEWDDVPSNEEAKPMWITDSKNNIKYEITQVNYAQVLTKNCIHYGALIYAFTF